MVKCKNENCNKRAMYNKSNETKGKYCKSHMENGMTNVVDKKCVYDGCRSQPSCNYPQFKNGIYCAKHKLHGMINVVTKKCLYNSCNTISLYNYPNNSKRLYCNIHKLEGMINVVDNRCEYENCNITPVFNFPNEKSGKYCNQHKLDGMINIKCRKCTYNGCYKQPRYNYPNEKSGKYCNTHKLDDMIDVVSKRCAYPLCDVRPSYNYPDKKSGKYCITHKFDDMIDIINFKKMCKTPHCETRCIKKYKGYCMRCFLFMFPNEKNARNYKTKEVAVADIIKERFSYYDITCDKTIQDGCSKYRPDIIIDLGYQVIIIEVDETQHKNYSCENKRMMTLSQDSNHRPMIMIRFNPDAYHNGTKKITSCWGIDGNGMCVVKKTKQKEWQQRCDMLCERITHWTKEENKSTKTIHVEQLFYDMQI